MLLIVRLNDHLNDSLVATMQDSGLEVLVMELHVTVIVEKINGQIFLLDDDVHHGVKSYVLRSRRYLCTPFQEPMDEFHLGRTPWFLQQQLPGNFGQECRTDMAVRTMFWQVDYPHLYFP